MYMQSNQNCSSSSGNFLNLMVTMKKESQIKVFLIFFVVFC